MDPLVSIITPTFNSERFIAQTIQSVEAQTYSNWELIIVDDASSDNTLQIINSFQERESRIKIYQLTINSGAGVARNKGIEMAQGDFIAFLDADDLWKAEKLSEQLQFMQERKALVSYSSYDLIDENGNSLNKKVKALPEIKINKLLKSNYIGNLTGVYNAKKLGKVYMPIIRKRQDWGLWIKCIEKAESAHGLDKVLASYRVRKGSISATKLNLLKYNYLFYRKACNFGPFKSGIYLIRFLFEHFLVKSRYIIKTNT